MSVLQAFRSHWARRFTPIVAALAVLARHIIAHAHNCIPTAASQIPSFSQVLIRLPSITELCV